MSYNYVRPLGNGATSQIDLYFDPKTFEMVALKRMDKDKIPKERYRREIDHAIRCKHPSVIPIKETLETDTEFRIFMDAGKWDLYMFMKMYKKKLTESDIRSMFPDIFNALEYCHSLGIVHLDIKPDNIIMTSNKSLKLIDFGHSVSLLGDQPNPLSTMGTIRYAAPELLEGGKITAKTDVWSLAVTLYFCITWSFPFPGENDEDYIKFVIDRTKEPKLKTLTEYNCSSDFISMIAKMLKKDPTERPTIAEIKDHPWFGLVRSSSCQ